MSTTPSKNPSPDSQAAVGDSDEESPPHHASAPISPAADNLVDALSQMDRRIEARQRERKAAPIGSARSWQRFREIERILEWHYGSILPDDDAGRDDMHVLLSVAKACGIGLEQAQGLIHKWAPVDDAKLAYTNASLSTAYLTADVMAHRLGVTYAERQSLRLRTIGAIDVSAAEREKIRRTKYDVKRKQDKAAKPKKLKPREQAILRMIGNMIGMGHLCRKAARHRLFHLENVPLEVRRVVKRLEKSGHLGTRKETRERGGCELYIWREPTESESSKATPL